MSQGQIGERSLTSRGDKLACLEPTSLTYKWDQRISGLETPATREGKQISNVGNTGPDTLADRRCARITTAVNGQQL